MGTRLDPEEALTGPLYVVAALLIVIPMADFVLSVPPAEIRNVQWRFAAVGLLSGHTLMPILGLTLALVTAAYLKHYSLQRLLVAVCLASSAVFIALTLGFLLDMLQLRSSLPDTRLAAFNSAWKRALVKYALSAGALAYMGVRAMKMIPARDLQRTPKTVHVVSK